jgi:hypothetical protein
MSAIAKLIAGVVIFLAGVYWYVAPLLGNHMISSMVPRTVGTTVQAFLVTFFGLFGLALILFGLIVAWIEFEDIKWERKEKKKVKK